MKTITVKAFQFSELSDAAKEKAIDWYASASGYDEWWDSTYEDAKNVGIKITGFDIRGTCDGEFIGTAEETANKIIAEHGDACETYKTAKEFLDARSKITDCLDSEQDKLDAMDEDDEITGTDKSYIQCAWLVGEFETELEDLETEFQHSILEDYRIILSNELDYLQSREHIIESIEANEYDFSETGSRTVVL